ncbi:MAG TPA: VWA domain-containing protein [Thermoanaerobaculia bacterium]|jgi:VWFA-related protein
MVKIRSLPVLCALAALGSGVGAAAAGAQEPGPVRETAEVSLVEVPVRVLDKNGAPMRGLEAKDFTLFDEGRPQEIVGFDAVNLADRAAVPGTDPLPAPARRRFLILFDFSFARPKSIVAARKAARDFVLDGLAGTDLAAVAVYSVEKGVRMLVTFTSDRGQLARAIETLGLEAPRAAGDPLAFAFDTSALHFGPRSESNADGAGRADAQAALIEHLQAMESINHARIDEYQRGRVRNLIRSFGELGQALDSIQGRKDVIYLSEGFDGRFLVGTRETDQERQWLIQGEQWKVDSEKRFGDTPLRSELDEMGRLMRRSDCVIHAVDIAGIRTDGDPEAAEPRALPGGFENSLFEIANGSGGEVFRNANDLRSQLDSLMTRTSLVYILAYRPDKSRGEGAFHELKVKVAAHGAKVSARPGYYERRGFRRLSPFERNLSAADVIANEIPMEEIPMRVLAAAFASGEPTASVPVLLEIPGDRFLNGQKGDRATAEIYVYATDSDNQLADFLVQSVALDLSKSRQKVEASGLKYYGELRLRPGRYRLRALVRNGETGQMGLSVSSLLVPEFARDQPYLAPPLFLEGAGDWVLVRGRRTPATPSAGADAGSPLLDLSAEGWAATAEPRLQPGSASRVCLVAYNFGAPGGNDELRLNGQVIAFDGRPVQEGSLSVVGRSADGADGKRILLLAFTAPANLSAGRYGLRIFVQDAAGRARQAWAPFRVP